MDVLGEPDPPLVQVSSDVLSVLQLTAYFGTHVCRSAGHRQCRVRLGHLAQTKSTERAIRDYKNHKTALLRFLEDPDIPIDNSPTEREFQNVAKLRLHALFAGSSEGAHRACVLLGIAATCRALGVSALRYMTWAFERLGTHRDRYDVDAADVTPAAFAASIRRDGLPRRRSRCRNYDNHGHRVTGGLGPLSRLWAPTMGLTSVFSTACVPTRGPWYDGVLAGRA